MKLFDTVFKRRKGGGEHSDGEVLSLLPPASPPRVLPTHQASDCAEGCDETRSVASTVHSHSSSALRSRRGNGPRQRFDFEGHSQQSQQVFLAPLPRRKMVVPESIQERKALYEKETAQHISSQYLYTEEEPRAATAFAGASAAPQYVPLAVTVTAAELCAVKRLASFDEPVRKEASLPIEISTSGYKLRWLHDPIRHSKPADPMTLLNMRTDYLLDGGTEIDHYPFIDSPRSVLVLVRNGTHPMALQRRPTRETLTAPHAAFKERLRVEELARLQAEYSAMCEVLPDSTIDAFFKLLHDATVQQTDAADDKSPNPQVIKPLLERDDDGIYRVAFHYEVSTAASDVVAQLDRTKANLRNLVASEIALTRSRTEALRQQQEKGLAASRKHDEQIAARRQQRKIAAAIKAETVQQRTQMRQQASEQLRYEAEARYNAKLLRLEANAARMEEEELVRKGVRRQREEEREQRRLDALRTADDHTERMLEHRTRIVERKNAMCAVAQRSKMEEQREAKARRQANEARALVRKQEMDEEKARAHAARQQKQAEREATAEAQVAGLRQEQQTTAAVKNLVALQRAIFMDERQQLEEERLALERESMLQRREDALVRQERLLTVLDHRRRERQQARDEVRVEKALFMERQSRRDQFTSLLTADAMLDAHARTAAASRAKDAMTREARYERELLMQWRQKTLQDAKKEAEDRERAATLSLYNQANPSDAVLFKAMNTHAVGVHIHKSRRGQQQPNRDPIELPDE